MSRIAPWLALLLLLPAAAKPPARPAPRKPAKPVAPAPEVDLPPAGAWAERIPAGGGRGRAVGAPVEARSDFQATRMGDGRVLVTGGSAKATSEWFDPAAGRFSAGPALVHPRQGHRALRLKDGRLLLVGGTEAGAPAEVLDPGTGAFAALQGPAFGLSAEAIQLDDGRVLLVDGASGQTFTWDGVKSPRSHGTLARPRLLFRLTLSAEGKVLVTGGWPSDRQIRGRVPRGTPSPNLPVEVFNPRWNSLSSWSATVAQRARHQATRLADGRICLWGGVAPDGTQAVAEVELLDTAKETVTRAGKVEGLAQPGWTETAEGGLLLAEQGRRLQRLASPLGLLEAAQAGSAGQLANAYLAPTLVPLADGGVLVLGAPAWGAPVDRWDPRTRAGGVLGSLRAGTERLIQLADGRVLAVGEAVDLLDPRSGTLRPLGWSADLAALLRTAKPGLATPAGAPPFAPGTARAEAAVVALDKTRALVIGGQGADGPSAALDLWDLRRKTLTPLAPLRSRRTFPVGGPSGALALADGAVLVWGPGPT